MVPGPGRVRVSSEHVSRAHTSEALTLITSGNALAVLRNMLANSLQLGFALARQVRPVVDRMPRGCNVRRGSHKRTTPARAACRVVSSTGCSTQHSEHRRDDQLQDWRSMWQRSVCDFFVAVSHREPDVAAAGRKKKLPFVIPLYLRSASSPCSVRRATDSASCLTLV